MDPGDKLARALLRVFGVDHSERSLPRVLEAALSGAIQLTGARQGSLYLARGEVLTQAIALDDQGLPSAGLAGPIVFSVARECLSSGEPVASPIVQAAATGAPTRPASVVGLPIRREERTVGVICVDRGDGGGGPGPRERAALVAFGDGVGLAMKKAEAYEQLCRQLALSEQRDRFCGIVSRDAAMREIFRQVQQVAELAEEAPVLIQGEPGTGKELLARALHLCGFRRAGPFVPISCREGSEASLERRLFGWVAGAFEGATSAGPGLFELSAGGTVFLDDVDALGEALQARLTRLLDEGVVTPVGSERPRAVDVWIVGATAENLGQQVAQGRFSPELHDRLAATRFELPPLRERSGDIPLLIAAFCEPEQPLTFEPEATRWLAQHPWPRNVAELEQLVDRLRLAVAGRPVAVEDLSAELGGAVEAAAPARAGGAELHQLLAGLDMEQIKAAGVEAAIRTQLEEQRQAGSPLRVNKSALAGRLGVTRKTVQNLLKRYQIDTERILAEVRG